MDDTFKGITYINEQAVHMNHAGNKARADVDMIFSEILDKSNVGYSAKKFHNIFEKILYVLSNQKMLKKLFFIKGKKLLLQYPLFFRNWLFEIILKRIVSNNDVVFLIHDLDCLRNATIEKDEEIKILNHGKACIVHNKNMTLFLRNNNLNIPLIELECFDYIRPNNEHIARVLKNEIAFAGNLNKSQFLRKINLLNNKFYLYGPSEESFAEINNAEYKGSFSPEVIPQKLEGSFGLIWDGESIETCSGVYGEYMKYNNPHKLSLYIAACLPAIVWSKAAIGDFVRKEQIGFCIDRLQDIDERIKNMTKKEYEKYIYNITQLSKKVISGYYTTTALNKAVEKLK